MHDNLLAIERCIAECKQHQARGEYRQSYVCIQNALDLLDDQGLGNAQMHQVLLEAARCAYYLSLFDESESFLDRLDESTGEVRNNELLRFESSIVRANIYRRQGRYQDSLNILKTFNIYGIPGCTPSLIAERFLIEGACKFYLNMPSDAEEKLEIALGLATQHTDSRIRSRVLTMLGFLTQSKGFLKKAEDYFTRARDLSCEQSDSYGEAAANLNASIVQYRQGRLDKAYQSSLNAKKLFNTIGWYIGICRSLIALGNIRRIQRDFSEARRFYRKAEKLALRKGFVRERSLAFEFLGEIEFELGDIKEAERHYKMCLRLAEMLAPEGDIVIEAYRRLGELHCATGSSEIALTYLEKSLTLSQKLGEKYEEGLILRAMGWAHAGSGELEKGAEYYLKAIEILKTIGGRFELAKANLFLADLLIERNSAVGDNIESFRDEHEIWGYLIEAGQIFREAGVEFWKKKVDDLLKKVTLHKSQFSHVSIQRNKNINVVNIEFSPEFMICNRFAAVSNAMKEVWSHLEFAAKLPRPVLITGETGTGKELIASFVHGISDRAAFPFIAVNCAAVPDHLFESEFFGHKKGCFTGATIDRRGIFEAARGGSIFLDEIGELTAPQQVKLLRVLQEGKVRRIGENIEHPVDVRIISATNQDLEKKLADESLRADFLFRINAERIHIPPLRERPEDIIPLVAYYLAGNGNGNGSSIKIESSALRYLQKHSWPGNVRELFSVLERVKHISNGNTILLDMLPKSIDMHDDRVGRRFVSPPGFIESGDRREDLKKVLALCKGNKSAAAKWLGISRGTLYKELRRSGLQSYIRDH